MIADGGVGWGRGKVIDIWIWYMAMGRMVGV